MNKVKKALIVVFVDFVMLAVLIYSVYMMLTVKSGTVKHNIFTILTVVSIPIIFYVTYLAFAGDKYKFDDSLFQDDETDKANDKVKGGETDENM
ncbi:MAG: hypothetical protein E7259_04100 [Lachnospiraceae bacterium]|nr:hypothetical protein [Lachnospiraceae bacterium]